MVSRADCSVVFSKLKAILEEHAPKLKIVTNSKDSYYLDTHFIGKNKKPIFFGAVTIGKAYVSFHLMPVYCFPELLNNISPGLKRHMQGKSCFNFSVVEKDLFNELDKLTKAGFLKFKDEKYV